MQAVGDMRGRGEPLEGGICFSEMDLAEDLPPWCPFPDLSNERAECFALFLVLHLQICPPRPPQTRHGFCASPRAPQTPQG